MLRCWKYTDQHDLGAQFSRTLEYVKMARYNQLYNIICEVPTTVFQLTIQYFQKYMN